MVERENHDHTNLRCGRVHVQIEGPDVFESASGTKMEEQKQGDVGSYGNDAMEEQGDFSWSWRRTTTVWKSWTMERLIWLWIWSKLWRESYGRGPCISPSRNEFFGCSTGNFQLQRRVLFEGGAVDPLVKSCTSSCKRKMYVYDKKILISGRRTQKCCKQCRRW